MRGGAGVKGGGASGKVDWVVGGNFCGLVKIALVLLLSVVIPTPTCKPTARVTLTGGITPSFRPFDWLTKRRITAVKSLTCLWSCSVFLRKRSNWASVASNWRSSVPVQPLSRSATHIFSKNSLSKSYPYIKNKIKMESFELRKSINLPREKFVWYWLHQVGWIYREWHNSTSMTFRKSFS